MSTCCDPWMHGSVFHGQILHCGRPKLWNVLPSRLQSLLSKDTFCCSLKTCFSTKLTDHHHHRVANFYSNITFQCSRHLGHLCPHNPRGRRLAVPAFLDFSLVFNPRDLYYRGYKIFFKNNNNNKTSATA